MRYLVNSVQSNTNKIYVIYIRIMIHNKFRVMFFFFKQEQSKKDTLEMEDMRQYTSTSTYLYLYFFAQSEFLLREYHVQAEDNPLWQTRIIAKKGIRVLPLFRKTMRTRLCICEVVCTIFYRTEALLRHILPYAAAKRQQQPNPILFILQSDFVFSLFF